MKVSEIIDMTHSILAKRKIALYLFSSSKRMNSLIPYLEDNTGIKKAVFNEEGNFITIEYDQLVMNFSGLISILEQYDIEFKTGFRFKLCATWYDYLDNTARENAAAPPPACCNRPPKR